MFITLPGKRGRRHRRSSKQPFHVILHQVVCVCAKMHNRAGQRRSIMKTITSRKVKTSVHHVQSADDGILHFTLDNLLPESHTLALNLSLGTLSLIANSRDNSYP